MTNKTTVDIWIPGDTWIPEDELLPRLQSLVAGDGRHYTRIIKYVEDEDHPQGPPGTPYLKELRFSHSASENFEDCPRKWYYGSVLGLEGKANASRSIGIDVHDALDVFATTGNMVDPDNPRSRIARLAWAGLESVPFAWTPDEGCIDPTWNFETWLPKETPEGESITVGPLRVSGKVDYWRGPQPDDNTVHIGDYKTTKFPNWNYSKTPKELAQAHQPLLYLKAMCLGYGWDEPEVTFSHVNICVAGPPKSEPVTATKKHGFNWDLVQAVWDKAEYNAHLMADYAQRDEADVPCNPMACPKFGGCGFAGRCSGSPLNRAPEESTFKRGTKPSMSTKMSAEERMAARFGAAAPSTPKVEKKVEPKPQPAQADGDAHQKEVERVATMLQGTAASMGGKLLAGVMEAVVNPTDVSISEVISFLGWRLDRAAGVYVPKAEAEPEPEPTVTETKVDPEPDPEPVKPTKAESQEVFQRWLGEHGLGSKEKEVKAAYKDAFQIKRVGTKTLVDAVTELSEGRLALAEGVILEAVCEDCAEEPEPEVAEDPTPGTTIRVEVVEADAVARAVAALNEEQDVADAATVRAINEPETGEVLTVFVPPTVYFGCAPDGEPTKVADVVLAPFMRSIEETTEEPYFLLYSDFNANGARALCGLVTRAVLAGEDGQFHDMVVPRGHPVYNELLSCFRSLGFRVVAAV